MANKMLIDAAHPEETRVVVVRGNRVEEFDFEAANRKQLRGNIYLAKVTRVEPSLQAAFVEYGGNRHGFLAFSEIHPDYYQIPVADRQALLDAEHHAEQKDDSGDEDEAPARKPRRGRRSKAAANRTDETVASEAVDTDAADETADKSAEAATSEADADASSAGNAAASEDVTAEAADDSDPDSDDEVEAKTAEDDDDGDTDGEDQVESVGAEDALEELPVRRQPPRRQYKIQEVIKRRQVILVQVVKEERGNKGAALTTYLSLAGRYSVLMPNTGRGGGISRKITQPTDRKRLKKIASELDVPEGMGVILRTAGASRTKAEIKRDFEYLMRLWENVRELTLKSSAPSLVYEEGSLIKRSIRDLYNKDINEVLVAGDEGYREAKDFMRMLMPSHAKNVQPYRDPSPIFIRNGVEPQLDAMFSPQVTLKSGGYIVINQTEALVSIDVNSGKSTREHNIEDTALQTNLEAAEEVTRQLRLRDLAGLVVIDFIDMEENKNNRTVERRLKDCLKNDRARIQVGRISHFGLLEMSRQRIRTGVLESSTTPCPHCSGTGMIRSVESVALHVLRSLEDNLLKGATHNLVIRTTAPVALYILNQKRANLSDLEARFAVWIEVQADDMVNGQHYVLERADPIDRDRQPQVVPIVQPDTIIPEEEEEEDLNETPDRSQDDGDRDRRRKRRRKRRRGGADGSAEDPEAKSPQEDNGDGSETGDEETDRADGQESEDGTSDDEPRRKRRRGRRGGRRGRRNDENGENGDESQETEAAAEAGAETSEDDKAQEQTTAGDEPADTEAAPAEAVAETEVEVVEAKTEVSETAEESVPPAEKDTGETEVRTPVPAAEPAEPVVTSEKATDGDSDAEKKPKRGGWWQRRSFF
ncbi:ribonuclease E/G [uncultured Roseibium sp.]|uniref:Rne/Rng family ribonuclease n=1 Tax=uncultured Roseibium sp. TaxID=1936171 RepID=UPI00321764B7